MISAARVGSVRGARRGDQPGDVGAHRLPKQPAPADVEVHVAEATGLVAGQPSQTVVAQGQFDDAVVLRSTDVRARGGGPQFDQQQVPPAAEHHRRHGACEPEQAGAQWHGGGDEEGDSERRQDQEGLQHLGEERDADRGPRAGQPPAAGAFLAGPLHAVGAGAQGQHQEGIGVVEAEHQGRDRGQREHRTGQQRGRRPSGTTDGGVQQRDGSDSLQGLRHQHAPRVESEEPDRDVHHPQRGGRLVDRDRVGRVAGAEQHGRPILRAGLDRRRVEPVRPAADPQVPQIEHGGAEEQDAQRHTVAQRDRMTDLVDGIEGVLVGRLRAREYGSHSIESR
jgi:hypothetical protein